jgi:hypothetical protein
MSFLFNFLLIAVGLAVAVAQFNATTTCVCTTVPCPIAGSNALTEGGGAKATYHYVSHNNIAVVSSASVTISMVDLDKGSETTSCTQSYSRTLDDDGVQDCDAGHILAHRLGGPGNQPINIFPQDSSINRGAYAQYEGKIYDCIKTYGASSASLSWSFAYSSTTRTKPDSVTYKAVFNGGTCGSFSQTFTNGK